MISLFAEREIAGEDGAREEMKHPPHDAYSQIQACRWNAHGMLSPRQFSQYSLDLDCASPPLSRGSELDIRRQNEIARVNYCLVPFLPDRLCQH
jgi:hypothetical protein